LIAQGLKIGTEYANQRRFKTSSWQTGPTLEGYQENAVIRELEAVIAEHPNEYVRVVGIDPNAKRRVLELIVQRPGERANLESGSSNSPNVYKASSSGHRVGSPIKTGLATDAIAQVRSLLAQGYQIGTEHADKRRFRTSSWQSCTPIESNRESEVMAALEACIAEHQGEYVRLLGIDSKAKRRVVETIIHRPDEKAQNASRPTSESFSSTSSYSSQTTSQSSSYGNNRLSSEVVAQVRSLLAQGHKIGMEHADKRRFRTSSWQSCTPIESTRENDVFVALENCIAEHQGEYVRLLGIDSQAKRRVVETIIQRP
jgi:carbon dioxide concentrating mechanism protein CcmM